MPVGIIITVGLGSSVGVSVGGISALIAVAEMNVAVVGGGVEVGAQAEINTVKNKRSNKFLSGVRDRERNRRTAYLNATLRLRVSIRPSLRSGLLNPPLRDCFLPAKIKTPSPRALQVFFVMPSLSDRLLLLTLSILPKAHQPSSYLSAMWR